MIMNHSMEIHDQLRVSLENGKRNESHGSYGQVMVKLWSSQHHPSIMNSIPQDDPPGKTGVLPFENDGPGGLSLRDS